MVSAIQSLDLILVSIEHICWTLNEFLSGLFLPLKRNGLMFGQSDDISLLFAFYIITICLCISPIVPISARAFLGFQEFIIASSHVCYQIFFFCQPDMFLKIPKLRGRSFVKK